MQLREAPCEIFNNIVNIKVAPYCLALLSFAFNYSLSDSVTENRLLQTSKSFISQQSGIPNDVKIRCHGNANTGQNLAGLDHLRRFTFKLLSEFFCF